MPAPAGPGIGFVLSPEIAYDEISPEIREGSERSSSGAQIPEPCGQKIRPCPRASAKPVVLAHAGLR